MEEELGAKAASITKARVFSKRGETLETSLPGEAFGISRLTLDESLWRRVQRLGVRAFEKADVREVVASGHTTTLTIKHAGAMSVLTPKVTVGAWGRRTRLDRQLERPFLQARHPWVGMKQHHRPVSAQAGDEVARMLGGQVELHAFEGGYCGLNYVDGGVINACALLTQEAFDRLGAGPDWRALALMMNRSSRSLWSRMHLLEPTETGTQAVAQVPFEQKNVYADGVFWLGDAAGMITPMTGDGQAMAIQSAGLLEPLIWDLLTALGMSQPPELAFAQTAQAWERQWHDHFDTRHRLGRALQAMLVRPRLAEGVIRVGASIPGLPEMLARATRG